MQTSEIATNLTHHFQGDDTENKVNVEQEENNHHSSVSGLDRSNATPEIVEQKEFSDQLEGSNNTSTAIPAIIPGEEAQMTTNVRLVENTVAIEELHEQDDTTDQAVILESESEFTSQAVTTRSANTVFLASHFTSNPIARPQTENHLQVPVVPVQATRPLVAACIDGFDMDVRHSNLRLFVTIPPAQIGLDRLSLTMGTWGNRILYNIGASYMWATPTSEIQTGTFLWTRGMTREPTFVTWGFMFLTEPQVFVGIRSINVSDNWRVNMQIIRMNSHLQGFSFAVDAPGSVDLEEVTLQWVATTNNRFRTGVFSVTGPTTQRISFTPIPGNSRPQVMLGITRIDLASSVNARVRLHAANITNGSFDLQVTTWHDSRIWILGGSYLIYA